MTQQSLVQVRVYKSMTEFGKKSRDNILLGTFGPKDVRDFFKAYFAQNGAYVFKVIELGTRSIALKELSELWGIVVSHWHPAIKWTQNGQEFELVLENKS